MSLDDIRNERLKKREELLQRGVDPYPAKTGALSSIGEVIKKFAAFSRRKKSVTVAGRLMAKREHGGSLFCDLQDESGSIQLYFKEDVLKDAYRLFLDTADIGDFISGEGRAFQTKRGEKTIEVREWRMLAKSLRPLPEKWYGLQDVEERFRKRYLDLLMNEEVRERFDMRSRVVSFLRHTLEKERFMEVETPVFHPLPGGALARPFATHHNALDIDLYLRIAKELYLKRLLVGGYERIFEIGKDFRNEGIDATHNPEFTMLELYAAYWDEERMMAFVESLFLRLVKETIKGRAFSYDGKEIKWKTPFARMRFTDVLSRYALIPDYNKETVQTLAVRAKQFGIEAGPGESKGKIADEIYKKICRPHLEQPTFVIHHPVDISPLAKKREENPQETRRFQLIAGGMELVNGFAELNDPIDQRERLREQEKIRSGGDEEAHRIDEDFLEAMEYGMPPTAGIGIGIDRLAMLLTDTKNIREVVLFPTMKPRIHL